MFYVSDCRELRVSNQIKSNTFATQQAECNITTERICRQDTKAAQNCTNRCPENMN